MPRRLLSIAHSYSVGSNRRLASELARTGEWDVTAVAPRRFHGDFGWHSFEVMPDERCAVEPVPVHFSRRVHVMTYGRRLSELLRQPWDLVHCWEEPYVVSAAQVALAIRPSVPLVFATFQNIVKRYPPPFNWIERYAMRRAAGVIAFGRTALATLEARGFDKAPVRVIPPGVDVDRFKPDRLAGLSVRRELGWSDDLPVVGFLGRFVPEKGLARLTSALDRVRSPWRALFVGSGPLEADLRAWSRRYGDRVALATSVSHEQVPRYLNAMDLLAAPSQTTHRWREQFGRMLIEAFACGVPVVASTSGEIPHVVGDAGLIVDECNAEAWTHAIERLIGDRDARAELSRQGRDRAVGLYSWATVAQKHSELFDSLIAQGVAGGGRNEAAIPVRG